MMMMCMAFMAGLMSAHALEVRDVRIAQHAEKTRIVMDVDQTVSFKAFTLDSPSRVVVDLPRFLWRAPAQVPQVGGRLVSSIRHGAFSSETDRVVFDMKGGADILSSFTLPAGGGRGPRIVIDLKPTLDKVHRPQPLKTERAYAAPQPLNSIAEAPAFKPQPIAQPPFKPQAPKTRVIVIDPGHGGKDPGAISGRTREKHIVLALSKALKKELESLGGYRVYLTRSDDRYIKLYERVKIARRKNADLFVSVHADSVARSHVRGASIYTLSEKASDAQTAKLAAKENKVDLISGIDLTHEDHDVAGILLDLVQRDTMNQSNFFAEQVVKAFKRNGLRMLENPHRSAGFAVLKAPDIPSVLIEAGFVSNKKDAKLLMQSSYQKKLAKTIASGIDIYVRKAQKH